MTKKNLVGYYYTKIVKSLKYLEYTYNRVAKLNCDPQKLSDEQLELWDSFAVRFARTSDLFLTKFLKALAKSDDPAFDGTFKDVLNYAEKMKVIQDIPSWLEIRELRNVTVHEYSDQDLTEIFKKLLKYTPRLINLAVDLHSYVERE